MSTGGTTRGASRVVVGGFAALGVGCCAVGPVLAGVIGGIALADAPGAVAVVVLVGLAIARLSRLRLPSRDSGSLRRAEP